MTPCVWQASHRLTWWASPLVGWQRAPKTWVASVLSVTCQDSVNPLFSAASETNISIPYFICFPSHQNPKFEFGREKRSLLMCGGIMYSCSCKGDGKWFRHRTGGSHFELKNQSLLTFNQPRVKRYLWLRKTYSLLPLSASKLLFRLKVYDRMRYLAAPASTYNLDAAHKLCFACFPLSSQRQRPAERVVLPDLYQHARFFSWVGILHLFDLTV
ncbi:hypothetical protein QBC37DRAFT_62839 [Rhypophila decipiens]|uniref:Uncharacterized protein n=1 Tax=Rhypophila decipiens TaxID=261697 RepID=A0AAN6YDL6_9PEZI|nr:hypothetical protein QBC37DRAFT_62839 [Rhypophila decipiens]